MAALRSARIARSWAGLSQTLGVVGGSFGLYLINRSNELDDGHEHGEACIQPCHDHGRAHTGSMRGHADPASSTGRAPPPMATVAPMALQDLLGPFLSSCLCPSVASCKAGTADHTFGGGQVDLSRLVHFWGGDTEFGTHFVSHHRHHHPLTPSRQTTHAPIAATGTPNITPNPTCRLHCVT